MLDAIALKKTIRTSFKSRCFVFSFAEINNRWKIRCRTKLLEYRQRVPVTGLVTKQDNVIARTREFVRQIARFDRVVRGDHGVRPMRCNVMHQQATEVRLPINDHDLDAHRVLLPVGNTLHTDSGIRAIAGHRKPFAFCFATLLFAVVSAPFDLMQVLVRHIPCHIFAGEAGSIKLGN